MPSSAPTPLAHSRWSERPALLHAALGRHLGNLPHGVAADTTTRRALGVLHPEAAITLRTPEGENISEEDGWAEGTAGVSLRKHLFRRKWDMEADALYLKKQHQGKGIGGHVFQGMTRAARDLGVDNITLQADDQGKAVWAKMPGMQFQKHEARQAPGAYSSWRSQHGGPELHATASPAEYPEEFLKNWSPGPVGFIGYRMPVAKAASAPTPGMSKEKHRALGRADAHFTAQSPNWDEFVQHAKRKSFVKAVGADPRADATLRRHVEQMHQLHAGKRIKTVTGDTGKYQVVKKPQGGLACTCPDWRYRRSVSFGEDQKCKHIRAHEAAQEKQAASPVLIGAALGGVAGAAREHIKQRPERDAYRMHGDLGNISPEVAKDRAKGRLRRVMGAGAGGAILGGLAGKMVQKAVPTARSAVQTVSHDAGHHFGRGAVEGARANIGDSPPKGRLWRMMLGGLAAEKSAGVSDNIAAVRAATALAIPRTGAPPKKLLSTLMGKAPAPTPRVT